MILFQFKCKIELSLHFVSNKILIFNCLEEFIQVMLHNLEKQSVLLQHTVLFKTHRNFTVFQFCWNLLREDFALSSEMFRKCKNK